MIRCQAVQGNYGNACLSGNDSYLHCILQALETSLGGLLQLLSASTEVFHLLVPLLGLKNLPQLLFPLPHGVQITMETPTLPQQCLS